MPLNRLRHMDLTDPFVAARVRQGASVEGGASGVARWVTISRVCGDLSVSRSLGDADFKGSARMAAAEGPRMWQRPHGAPVAPFTADLVLSTPDVRTVDLRGPVLHVVGSGAGIAPDALLILACDGLWDVMTPAEVALLARRYVLDVESGGEGRSPRDAARGLVDMALKLGSGDNVTVVVVVLPTAPQRFRSNTAHSDPAVA